MTTIARARRIDGDIVDEIRRLAAREWSPAQIDRHLQI